MKVKSIFTLEGELGALSDKALLARAEDEGLGYWDLRVRAKWVARLRRRLGKSGFTETCRLPDDLDLGFWLRTVLVVSMAQALYSRQPRHFVPAGTKIVVFNERSRVVTRNHPVKRDMVPPRWLDKLDPGRTLWSITGTNSTEWRAFLHSSRIGLVRRSDLRTVEEV